MIWRVERGMSGRSIRSELIALEEETAKPLSRRRIQGQLTYYFGWLSGIIFLVLVMIDYEDRRRKP